MTNPLAHVTLSPDRTLVLVDGHPVADTLNDTACYNAALDRTERDYEFLAEQLNIDGGYIAREEYTTNDTIRY